MPQSSLRCPGTHLGRLFSNSHGSVYLSCCFTVSGEDRMLVASEIKGKWHPGLSGSCRLQVGAQVTVVFLPLALAGSLGKVRCAIHGKHSRDCYLWCNTELVWQDEPSQCAGTGPWEACICLTRAASECWLWRLMSRVTQQGGTLGRECRGLGEWSVDQTLTISEETQAE